MKNTAVDNLTIAKELTDKHGIEEILNSIIILSKDEDIQTILQSIKDFDKRKKILEPGNSKSYKSMEDNYL